MKSCSTLLVALGLVSSTVLAQSVQSVPQQPSSGGMSESGTATPPAGAGQYPPPTMGSGSQVPSGSENGGGDSSGASGMQTSTSGGGGQLITPDIAQSRPASSSSSVAVTPRTENGVTYMCGGVGEDETAYMKQAAAKDYDLMMTFAEKTGSYVANVDVSIVDARGRTVLETKCDGPILLVDLPSGGNYRIHAESGGRTIDRSAAVKAGKGHARPVTFVWPSHSSATSSTGSDAGSRESYGTDSYRSERYGRDKE
ncbi:hypothetical protein EDC30_11236 [Paucimonas lemoignei]|uniref:Uncharacterized protein n=1 Tax=Paucimonas lemoignei TaxID=29443 RepID=A0A4R3HTN8_PAULE|nr:hypothetical protein [Paucimonas lemoignei]TCS34706.1 hypothetical protein EDC30_11236 [Paucimonas lemoignei]